MEVKRGAMQLSHFSGRQVSYNRKGKERKKKKLHTGGRELLPTEVKGRRGHLLASFWDNLRVIEGVTASSSEAGSGGRSKR